MKLSAPLAFVFLLALAACSTPTPAVPPTSAPATPGATAVPTLGSDPTATAAPTREGSEMLVAYNKTGCFAGVDDKMVIYADGSVEFTDRTGQQKKGKIKAQQVAELEQLFAQPAFFALKPSYPATGADLCTYSVTARQSDGSTKTVVAMDGAEYPEILNQVIQTLESIARAIQ